MRKLGRYRRISLPTENGTLAQLLTVATGNKPVKTEPGVCNIRAIVQARVQISEGCALSGRQSPKATMDCMQRFRI